MYSGFYETTKGFFKVPTESQCQQHIEHIENQLQQENAGSLFSYTMQQLYLVSTPTTQAAYQLDEDHRFSYEYMTTFTAPPVENKALLKLKLNVNPYFGTLTNVVWTYNNLAVYKDCCA